MMTFIIRLIINALVILGVAHFIPGIFVASIWAALAFAIILGIVNAIIRPLLILLTLPVSVITLGLFTLVINTFTFWLASLVSFGVHVETISAAFWGGLICWIAALLTNHFVKSL